jgi:hypothetical protein
MPIETMLTDDYDPEFELPDAPDPGRYHAVIVRVDEDGGKNGEMIARPQTRKAKSSATISARP